MYDIEVAGFFVTNKVTYINMFILFNIFVYFVHFSASFTWKWNACVKKTRRDCVKNWEQRKRPKRPIDLPRFVEFIIFFHYTFTFVAQRRIFMMSLLLCSKILPPFCLFCNLLKTIFTSISTNITLKYYIWKKQKLNIRFQCFDFEFLPFLILFFGVPYKRYIN